ncbi:Phosphatidylglycerophosphatase B [Sutcliffiella rhizosphaerae]|uniref:Phosphatidylglycerophosphatase B n=2 Tax=Sutcliffiella rhizosphaerae TaxID=2880967 RepID=A0ABM8YPK4_9BACI|nr:Phosphatidylglycerophosphatase B [Sutcliffiella rhizosphaerae]
MCIAFLSIVVILRFNQVVNLDKRLGESLYQFASMDTFFIIISDIGSRIFFYPALIVISILLAVRKKWLIIILLWVNLLGVRLMNTWLKAIFVRERPTLEHVVEASYYSFPSGHSMNSIAFFGLLAILSFIYVKRKWLSYAFILLFSILILLIGISRIYLGVHFPLDVLAGFFAGLTWLFFISALWAVYLKKEFLAIDKG